MTSATGPGLSADDLCRRLRAWPSASWEHGDRVRHAREALHRLAALAAQARGRPAEVVPELSLTAMGDQLTVLVADAARAGVAPPDVDAVLRELSVRLGLR